MRRSVSVVGLVVAALLATAGVVTSASADGSSVPCTYVAGSGAYGYDVGADENFTPVVQDYSLIGLVSTSQCTTAQLEIVAVPSVGTPMACTLYFPDPVHGSQTACDNVTGTEAFVEPGTTVKLTAVFVGAGPGGADRATFSCTTIAPAAPRGQYGQVNIAAINGSLFNWNVGHARCYF